MKLSEKLFLWFSSMIAVMLVVILVLAGLQKQGIFDVAAVFQGNAAWQQITGNFEQKENVQQETIQFAEKETIQVQETIEEPTEEMTTEISVETATDMETTSQNSEENETETVPQVIIDVSEQVMETTAAEPEEPDPYPYYIKVNKTQNCVTIYEKDEAGEYTVPIKAMICSTGNATPIGTFDSKGKYVMKGLINGVYGQYSTWITGNILFHSVPCSKKSKDSVSVRNYNQLGTTASAGCIRLTVADAKWIYDNCEIGTLIEIYNDKDEELPLGKPEAIKLPEGSGWDPTDPDPENPWHECEPSITVEEQIILYSGQPWTPHEDIVALDTCGNDISEKAVVTGEVDCFDPGIYEITFSVTDAIGRTAEASCEYLVIPVPYSAG